MGDMDDIVKEFLVESYENLDQLDRDFVALETDPTATDKLSSIFRTIHTIKGTCGCLGLSKLESVAHVGENLLSRLRDGQLVMDTDITTGLLKLVDAVREILASIETTGAEGDKDYTSIKQLLIQLNERPSVGEAAPAAPSTPPAAPEAPVAMLPEAPAIAPPPPAESAAAAEAESPKPYDGPERRKGGDDSLAGNAIRVDVNLLDKLMNLVGELVLTRNQVLQHTSGQKDVGLLRTAQRLNLITTELQEGVMKTRMQPIGNLWNKFPRIVRDVANACGKKVRVEMEGRDTELDKTIIEAIKDPLTHVIRNSVDHGIESPDKRRAAGKDEEGRLFMRAFHEGGQVNIEIIDDGKGIDPATIKRKAVEKGLITAEQAARMGEREATNLIFLPGFSTAEKITNVSGRGVGMDVVKTNVERIGGAIDITSRVGQGTTLRIKIPLTLAIIPALVVTAAGERFAIPQVSLQELVRIDENDAGIEVVNGTPLYRLRGNLLPLVYLDQALKLTRPAELQARADRSANIVVLHGGARQFGLVVDHINDTEEIVVKPLAKQLKGINVLAGATIMGDGKVALILDVMGLAHQANVSAMGNAAAARTAAAQMKTDSVDRQMLLLFQLEGDRRIAIPLSTVARLEEFPRSSLEHAGPETLVQYRGQIMPLINVGQMLGDRRAKSRARRVKKDRIESDKLHVVVYSAGERNVGLQVERILDVVDEQIDLQTAAARPGVLGTAVIKDKVTELLDVAAIVREGLSESAKEAA